MGVFVIFDEETEYARSLMEYVSGKKGMPFKTRAFSDKEALQKYGKDTYIEIMLIADEALDETTLQMDVGQFVILSQGEEVAYYAEYPRIYKYQSAENILGEIIEYYMSSESYTGKVLNIKGDVADIIAVYSPVARSGKTSFALTLGNILINEGPVLYVNMEEFSGLGEIFSKEYRGDLADLMYHYRQSPESVSMKVKAISNSFHGVDYIPPMAYSGDVRNVKTKYWVQMIKDIASSGMYHKIILDLSNMPEDVFEILSICDTIYTPIRSDRISMSKLKEYEQFMLRTEREEILNRTVKVKIPEIDCVEWNENYIEKLLWGETGDFIRKILQEEVAC